MEENNLIDLTMNEKLILKERLVFYKSERNKTFKSLLTSIFGGLGALVLFTLFIDKEIKTTLIFAYLGLAILMASPITIGYYTSRKGILRLASDIELNQKKEGISKVKRRHPLSAKIILENNIIVYETDEQYKSFRKGDSIAYQVSISNEWIFKCHKV